MSIGETNDEWEQNRLLFVESVKDNLPISVDEDFKNRKLKVLLGCMNYRGLTGSEISTYELAKGLKEYGCEVHIYSNIGGILEKKSKLNGIKLHNLNSPPGYKMGDGIWYMNNNGVKTVSEKNKLYKVEDLNFDIIQINHQPIGKTLLNLFPNSKFVNIVRSRMLPVEFPLIDGRIKKYITINEVVEEFVKNKYNINSDNIKTIFNIATHKNTKSSYKVDVDNFILLPGTMNYLRKEMVYDITEKTKKWGKNLVLVGNDSDFGYAKKISDENEHVFYYGEMENLENLYKNCDMVCGLYLGRTLIEGFHHNKKGVCYLVDKEGNIENIKNEYYPKDMEIFKKENILGEYIDTYKSVINGK